MSPKAKAPTGAEREELEREREFLVRSLEDLERERADGGIDDDTYTTLHSDYTARAAAVIRTLDGRAEDRPKPPPIPRQRYWLAVALIVLFAGAALFSVTRDANPRGSAGLTGGIAGATTSSAPANSYAGKMQEAERQRVIGNPGEAAKRYLDAAKLDPKRPDPLVEVASLLITQVRQADKPDLTLLTTAQGYLDKAAGLDANYPDTHAMQGILDVLQGKDDAARAELRTYLRLAPDGKYQPMAKSFLDAPASTTPTTTGTTKKP